MDDRVDGKIEMVRTIVTVAATLVVAVFVQSYGVLQANLLQYGHGMELSILPLPTMFYHRYSPSGYLLPVAVSVLSWAVTRDREGRGLRMEIIRKAAYLAGSIWLLGCLLAWQLPHYFPVAVID